MWVLPACALCSQKSGQFWGRSCVCSVWYLSQTCFNRKWYCTDVPIQLLNQGWLGSHPSSVCKRQVNMLGLQCEFFWSRVSAHMHFSWHFCRDQHFPHLLRYDVCWLITGCLLIWKGRSLYFLDGNVTIQRYAICFLFIAESRMHIRYDKQSTSTWG